MDADPQSPERVAARLRAALELFDLGERMVRARLRREHPDATDAEIEAMFRRWLERPEQLDDLPPPLRVRRP